MVTLQQTDNPRMSARDALEMGRGIAKRLGATLTVDRFLELRRQDGALEAARMQPRGKKQAKA
jgi:hypothetical protein